MEPQEPLTTDEPASAAVTAPVGSVTETILDGEPVVLVGVEPYGWPVILTPAQWEKLKRWKLTRLRFSRGHVWAGNGPTRRIAARFLTGTDSDPSKAIRYRSGNPLDIRPCNVVVVSSALIYNARLAAKRPPDDGSPTVTLRDGRVRSKRKHKGPTAVEKLEKLVHG
jgi:hypothetical protein